MLNPRLLILFIVTMTLAACTSETRGRRYEFAEIVMGVKARVVLYAEDEPTARAGARAAFDRMNELDAILSDYRSDSEAMRLCRTPPGAPTLVSDDLFRVLMLSQQVGRRSNGALDVTIGPIVQEWRAARRDGAMPSAQSLDEARTRSGWDNITLHPETSAVELHHADMRLDFGGIGKGYAVDKALNVLKTHSLSRAMVELGGDLAVLDPPPGRNGWRVQIGDNGDVRLLAHTAVASSGDTEQFVEIDGVRYSHIIDPRTGMALTDRRQVTVIAPSATLADALASAISVLGKEESEQLLQHYSAAQCIIRTAQ